MQFYNPDFLREFGVGVVNGSLWTIPVELQFYCVLPVLFFLAARLKKRWFCYWASFLFVVLLLLFNWFAYSKPMADKNIFEKLFAVSLAPYLYMFLCGALFYKYFDSIHPFVTNRLGIALLAYATVSVVAYTAGFRVLGNEMNPVSYLFLALVVFCFAYSWGGAADKLLKGNDVSYSIYVYHMLVVNVMLEMDYVGSWVYLLIMIVIVFLLAFFSWRFIESPALGLKKYSFHRKID